MFSPKLYSVRKIPARDIISSNFNINIKNSDYMIKQQDCMVFRQIRIVTNNIDDYLPYIVFIDCNGSKGKKEDIKKMVINGIVINGIKFVMSERSASMTRNAILGFIDESIYDRVYKAITMDIDVDKAVLSKWCAYRGLMFSSCHCIENYMPKIVIVKDYKKVIENQNIKYLVSKTKKYIDEKSGLEKEFVTSDIEEGTKDIKINAFDGCGIHHPDITREIKEMIGIEENPTTIMIRMPWIKGVSHCVDYTSYFKDHGIDYITDIWGVKHSVYDKMFILEESMYKGYSYFNKNGDYRDWDLYLEKFKKYNHCFGVAKWNFSEVQEPVYTRANYQILQDLDLDFDEFKTLTSKSLEWAHKIVNGDKIYTYSFLGLNGENPKQLNNYAKAIMKNPKMINESCVKDFLKKQMKKYIDKMKCGKIYIKACYKFEMPDIIMLLQWIGGDENPSGSLESDEFWSKGYDGEYLIDRNPHICKSEHLVLKTKKTEEIEKYCGHLSNTCMLNCKSVSAQRLNGSDFDGDLVLLIDEPVMISGVDKNTPIVLNLDEKLTAMEEPITKENIANLVERTLVSLIGEDSNAATCYHNKPKRNNESKKRYDSYVDILSIVNSFAIDFAKTGYIMQIPYVIAKYSKPYPYFMRYVSDYYNSLYLSGEKTKSVNKFHKSMDSNMNKLSFMIEKFHNKEIKWKRFDKFDYSIMVDSDINIDEEVFSKIENLYLDFNKELKYLTTFENKLHSYDKFKNELSAWTKEDAINYHVNWDSVYSKYSNACDEVCKDKKMLANICVELCYNKYKCRGKKFLWAVASSGLLDNLKQVSVKLPERDCNGDFEYLGKKYSLVDYVGN